MKQRIIWKTQKKKSVEGYERGDNVAAPFVLAFVIRHFFFDTHIHADTKKKKKKRRNGKHDFKVTYSFPQRWKTCEYPFSGEKKKLKTTHVYDSTAWNV